MKTGVMSASEFVTGAGIARLRRQPSVSALKKKADAARARAHARISDLADQRLQLLVPWWHQKFPTRKLEIVFGNGSDHVSIDGRSYYPAPFPPHPSAHESGTCACINRAGKLNWSMFVPPQVFRDLDQALRDVDDITNGHRDGVPGDFVIEPVRKRGVS